MAANLLVDRDGPVVTLTLNRPDKLNALNEALLTELRDAILELDRDPAVRAAVLTGAGDRAFAAGADIASMLEMSTASARKFAELGHEACARLEEAHFPVIAAV